MPKKLLAAESESEYDNEYDASNSVAETLSKLDIQPTETKQKRTLTAEHKAKMIAGKKKAAELRKLESMFGKSAMDLKLGVLETNGLLTHEKLEEFQKIYEELTNDRIKKSTLKIKQGPKGKKVMAETLLPEIPKPILKEESTPTAPIPIPIPVTPVALATTPMTPKPQRKTEKKPPSSRRVPAYHAEPEESQSEFDESDNEPMKPVKKPVRKSAKKQLPVQSDSEFSTTAEIESDSDLDNSYFDMNIFNGFAQEQLPPPRHFNLYR